MSDEDEAFRDLVANAPAKRPRHRPPAPQTCDRCRETQRSRSNLRLVVDNDAADPTPPRRREERRG